MAGQEAASLSRSKKVLDRREALDRVADDAQILASLIDLFEDELPGMMEAIRGAMKSGDAEALNRAAHRLKGSVSVFGAEAMAEAAFALEQAGRSGDVAATGQRFCELEQEIARLHPALAEFRRELVTSSGR